MSIQLFLIHHGYKLLEFNFENDVLFSILYIRS